MIRGFYSAASGMTSQQTNLNSIANNVANISTTGFKPQQASFSSLLYENINGQSNPIQCGHGIRLGQLGIDFKQGQLFNTEMPLDCAILGEGFFAVEDQMNGTVTYTRDGNFQIQVDGKDRYLVNSSGEYVLDPDGDRIELKEKITEVNGKKTGTGQLDLDQSGIGVWTFPNPYALNLIGGNRFEATEAAGEPEAVENPAIQFGYLESSAVDMAKEMVKMIEASKAFSLNSRVLQTADELEKTVNQWR